MVEKMKASTDENNRRNFVKLLPSFFYDDETYERLKAITLKQGEEHFNPLYNLSLPWGHDDRYFVELTQDHINDMASNESWETFRDACFSNGPILYKGYRIAQGNYSDRLEMIIDDSDSRKDPYSIYYDDFIKNTFRGIPEVGLEGGKLLKRFQKIGLLTSSDIDEINKQKVNVKEKTYFCISRNPIDFLMASTNQSFTSCLNLESNYESAYYMSLPAMLLDPSRYLCFYTKGVLAKYTTKGYTFKHFRYTQRFWLLQDKNNIKFHKEKCYPENKYAAAEMLASMGIKLSRGDVLTREYKHGKFCDGTMALIYLDGVRVVGAIEDVEEAVECSLTSDEHICFSGSHKGGNGHTPKFDYEEGFEDLNEFKDLNNIIGKCFYCGSYLRDPQDLIRHKGKLYCSDCFENFRKCSVCSEPIAPGENAHKTCEGEYVCDTCVPTLRVCIDCSRPTTKIYFYALGDSVVGAGCSPSIIRCANCGTAGYRDDFCRRNGERLCARCTAPVQELTNSRAFSQTLRGTLHLIGGI